MPRSSAGAASKRTPGSEKRKAAAGSFRSARRQWIAISVAPASAAARPTCCSIWCSIPRWSERHESSQQRTCSTDAAPSPHSAGAAVAASSATTSPMVPWSPKRSLASTDQQRTLGLAARAARSAALACRLHALCWLVRSVSCAARGIASASSGATATQRLSEAKKAEDEAAAVCTCRRAASSRYSFVRDSSSRVGAWRAGGASNAQHSRRKAGSASGSRGSRTTATP